MTKTIAQAVVTTAELVGHELSPAAATAMAAELAVYPASAVLESLRRCQRELKGRLTLADVLDRLAGGFPGPEEAWAACPRSEAQTVVWTGEAAEAFGAAAPLLEQGDNVGARMAFKETYSRLVATARAARRMPRWTVSPGHDSDQRCAALSEAVARGRLTAEAMLAMLPYGTAAAERAERDVRKLAGLPLLPPKALPQAVQNQVDKIGRRP